jgi:hypothetical protein
MSWPIGWVDIAVRLQLSPSLWKDFGLGLKLI